MKIMTLTEFELELLRTLRPKQHSIWVMFRAGKKYEEIAADLNLPVGTVRSRIHRARRHVQRWRDEGAIRKATDDNVPDKALEAVTEAMQEPR